ncbi:MAG: DUF1015 domain-containing protein [Myxococcales bacterium]|nr:DUF1015 domain-containing protein [Myxococcales bacterium]
MAEIAPLTALRYDLSRVDLGRVVAPPYDVIDAPQRASLEERDPHNIVRLILPSGDGDAKYANAAGIFESWRKDGTLVRDDVPAFLRYDQTFLPPGAPSGAAPITRRGFFALVRLSPFSERVILPHERTLSGPKEDRLKLFRATRTNLSPGFMLYRDADDALAPALAEAEPLAEFSTDDGVRHVVSKVRKPEAMRAIVRKIADSSLLIADGHHRYETALRYSSEVDAAVPNASARGRHRYFMAFLANGDDPNLVVFPTHRHLHSLASFDWDGALRGARELFDVRPLADGADAPALLASLADAGKGAPSLVVCASDGRAALLTLRGDVDLAKHATLAELHAELRRTDVALLHSGLLEAVLGVTKEAQAQKTNLYYPQDAPRALAELRGGKGQALFLMNATPVRDVRRVAEAGEVMPQKSTFFFPKIATGVAIHTLEHDVDVASA